MADFNIATYVDFPVFVDCVLIGYLEDTRITINFRLMAKGYKQTLTDPAEGPEFEITYVAVKSWAETMWVELPEVYNGFIATLQNSEAIYNLMLDEYDSSH
jgi:hypothetical protein